MLNLIGHDSAVTQRKAWLRSIVVRSTELWGVNRHHRRQWVRQTVDLYDRGAHRLQNNK